jgi:hypothetical protein
MSFWTAAVVIALGYFAMTAGRAWASGQRDASEAARRWEDLGRRLAALEERTSNLETLLLEDAKRRRFDALGGGEH